MRLSSLRYVLVLLLLLVPARIVAQPVVVGTPTSSQSTGSDTLTFSHTVPSGSDRLLVVIGGGGDGTLGTRDITGVTFNGNSLTNGWSADGGSWVHNEMWYLIAPTETTADVVITYGDAGQQQAGGAFSLTGVDQTTPVTGATTASGSSVSPLVNFTCTTSDLAVGGVHTDDNNGFVVDSPGVERWIETAIASDSGGQGVSQAGAASTTIEWSTNNDEWAVGGACIKSSGGAASKRRVVVAINND